MEVAFGLIVCDNPECQARRLFEGAVPYGRCGRCRRMCYCGRACQAQDWKRHRPECQKAGGRGCLYDAHIAEAAGEPSPKSGVWFRLAGSGLPPSPWVETCGAIGGFAGEGGPPPAFLGRYLPGLGAALREVDAELQRRGVRKGRVTQVRGLWIVCVPRGARAGAPTEAPIDVGID